MAGMVIFVRNTAGELQPVDVGPTTTVADVALQAQETGGLRQVPHLVYQGEKLAPTAQLADVGVCSECVLDILAAKFEKGQRLEAVDRKTPGYACVATIEDIEEELGGRQRLRIHFDGWTTQYDYWCDADSDNIAPIGYCKKIDYLLQQPKMDKHWYGWDAYLRRVGAEAAPVGAFAKTEGLFSGLARRAHWTYMEQEPPADYLPAPKTAMEADSDWAAGRRSRWGGPSLPTTAPAASAPAPAPAAAAPAAGTPASG
eukprot:TRINITY_DN2071_c0_g1_i1.p1 TRINITY_DN2071_c0_g1~~TRINITY_DN2071_c0_g1_i1.p1  ORF type:complete len:277 (+),score=101.33 TRINITY_DN2071_c0_g1_i1:62-832(+)